MLMTVKTLMITVDDSDDDHSNPFFGIFDLGKF